MKKDTAPDQTQFMAEELLFEEPTLPTQLDHQEKPQKKLSKTVVVALVMAVLLISVGIYSLTLRRSPQPIQQVTETPLEPSPSSGFTEPLQKRLTELQSELNASNPSDDDYPLPVIDMELTVKDQ